VRAAALSLLTSVALILLSAVSVSADANPANHGHHYGQVKHRGTPPPAQAPPPATTTQPPATNTSAPATTSPAAALSHGVEAITSAMSPVAETRPATPQTQAVKIVRAVPQRDQLWWLLLVLAATLAVLWLFVSVQLARTALQRRAGPVSG
jgi:hypothetical protein